MPVATKEATGIDSRDEGVPLPLNLNPNLSCGAYAVVRPFTAGTDFAVRAGYAA